MAVVTEEFTRARAAWGSTGGRDYGMSSSRTFHYRHLRFMDIWRFVRGMRAEGGRRRDVRKEGPGR